jgi:transcriptional regulator with XRE-family HTH domain
MQYLKDISSYIKKRRIDTGISLNTFCFDNNIEPATLSRYENGKRRISLENLTKIAQAFKQTPAEFLTDFEKTLY